MKRLEYGYDDMKKINPSIIYCSASGWGDTGPYLKRPGQDLLAQSISGAIMTSGKENDGPVAIGTALCDQVNALNSVYAILSALFIGKEQGLVRKSGPIYYLLLLPFKCRIILQFKI